MEELTADVVKIGNQLEPEEVLESLQPHIQLEWMRRCSFSVSKETDFLRWNVLLVEMLLIQ